MLIPKSLIKRSTLFALSCFLTVFVYGQKLFNAKIVWSKQKAVCYFLVKDAEIWAMDLIDNSTVLVLDIKKLETDKIINIESFDFSENEQKILLFCNGKRKWRHKTQGDYFVYEVLNQNVHQIGKTLQKTLSFAKFSPDGNLVAYIMQNNIYVENLNTKITKQLTNTGSEKVSNGTFDWSYEEEFSCKDGFRWSYDGQHIAFWNIDASAIPYFTMLNNTDSTYPSAISFPYPKVNYAIPKVKIGIVDLTGQRFSWLNFSIANDSFYAPRMDWYPNEKKLICQYLNRQQNKSKLYSYNFLYKKTDLILSEKDTMFMETKSNWKHDDMKGWEWVDSSGAFLWMSEKNGFRSIYLVNQKGEDTLVTNENFDVMELLYIDKINREVYFSASPNNSTQKYLYKKSYKNLNEKAQLLTPERFKGKNSYQISPDGKYAIHSFTNYYTPEIKSLIQLNTHTIVLEEKNTTAYLDSCSKTPLVQKIKFIKIPYPTYQTELDAFIVYPDSFRESKKYPVLFYVYGEPASQIVVDAYKNHFSLYKGKQEYIYVGIDNRGAPQPKGRAFRKAIYGKIGIVNVEDQVYGAKEILKYPYIDTSRVGVWGWSGGGSLSLNLILQYPSIYKTAVSIAPVTDLKLYDNIYEERYMNLLDSNATNYVKGSAINYAKNLQGNLLLIHGTGDDNVHFQNTEVMVNEFIKYNKKFNLMIYPNRSHGIYEGENTTKHLQQTVTDFLDEKLFYSK